MNSMVSRRYPVVKQAACRLSCQLGEIKASKAPPPLTRSALRLGSKRAVIGGLTKASTMCTF